MDHKAAQAIEKALAQLRQPFSWDGYVDEFEQRLTALIQEKLAARAKAPTSASRPASGKRKRATPAVTEVAVPRRARAA